MTLKATPKARRLLATGLSVLAGLMVVGAVGLLGYPTYTDIREHRDQTKLRAEFDASSTALKQAYQAASTGSTKPSAGGQKVTLAEGSPITRIQIPAINLDTVVVQGTSSQALDAGTGHYPQTPLPCSSSGNVAIAGHRTMNGHPFQDLPSLKPGDTVTLITPLDSCVYTVVEPFDGHSNPWVTSPNDWTVIAQTTQPMLTLTTCTPEGTATQRYAVRLLLTKVTALAPGASGA
ncbi:MAG: class E sortase [Actinomycetota bacterium]